MFNDYTFTDLGILKSIEIIDDAVDLESFNCIRYPLELREYIYASQRYSDIALRYIQEVLFFSENNDIVYDSILFCLEYSYNMQSLDVIQGLELNNLEDAFTEERLRMKIWDMLGYSDYSEFALDLLRFFGWVDDFYNGLVEEGSFESKVCAELLLEGISTDPCAHASKLIMDKGDDVRIDTYLLPRIGSTKLAFENYNNGLFGEALNYIDEAKEAKIYQLFPEYNNQTLETLESKIVNEHNLVYKKIKDEYDYLDEFLTENSKEAFIHAEYLFQVHGRALNEYSSILNAYARCIEIQLKEVFLPTLIELIEKHGSIDKKKKKFLIYFYSKKRQKMFILPEYKYTLGKFHHLFSIEGPGGLDSLIWDYRKHQNNRHSVGSCEQTFYGALYEEYKTHIDYKRFVTFGNLLKKITKDYRNDASHGSVRNFKKVIEIREDMRVDSREQNIFQLLSFSKSRNLLKTF